MNLESRLRRLEASPRLILARLLPDVRRLEGQPDDVWSQWLNERTTAELKAIVNYGPGDMNGLTNAEMERIAAGEDPDAVLGVDQARARGFVSSRALDVQIEREIERVTQAGVDVAAIERSVREAYR